MLRWIWEECEHADAIRSHYAIDFRDVTLLTKGPITDDRLPGLWSLRTCPMLDLTNAQITDAGLAHLKGLTNLKVLYLSGTQITWPFTGS